MRTRIPRAPRRAPRGERLERAAFLVLALYLAGTAMSALRRGEWLYTDYLGLRVPSPLAVVAALLVLAVALGRWTRSR